MSQYVVTLYVDSDEIMMEDPSPAKIKLLIEELLEGGNLDGMLGTQVRERGPND